MNTLRLNLALGTLALAAGILVVSTETARTQTAQGNSDTPVKLQTKSPGVAQSGHANLSGTLIAGYFKGNGTALSALNASNMTTGTLPDARLSARVPRLDQANTFTWGPQVFTGDVRLQNSGGLDLIGTGHIVMGTSDVNTDVKLLAVTNEGAGEFMLNGKNGTNNVFLGYPAGYPSQGWMGVRDSYGVTQVSAYVNSAGKGVINADIKNFVVPNPRNDAQDIVYACVEGPEAAAYIRGTVRLVNGHARVVLPQHFQDVTVSNGITVQLTPGSRLSEGVGAENRSNAGFDVYELHNGHGAYDVDWEVKAVRQGHEDYRAVRDWDEALPNTNDRSRLWASRLEAIRSAEASAKTRRLMRP